MEAAVKLMAQFSIGVDHPAGAVVIEKFIVGAMNVVS